MLHEALASSHIWTGHTSGRQQEPVCSAAGDPEAISEHNVFSSRQTKCPLGWWIIQPLIDKDQQSGAGGHDSESEEKMQRLLFPGVCCRGKPPHSTLYVSKSEKSELRPLCKDVNSQSRKSTLSCFSALFSELEKACGSLLEKSSALSKTRIFLEKDF